jgi:outer membrane receptor protein involved in Fe transport
LEDLRFSLTFFINILKNPISQFTYDDEPDYTQIFLNSSDAKTRGFEFETNWQILKNTVLTFNMTQMFTNEASSVFPRTIINWGIEHRFKKVPLQMALFNRHQFKAKDGNFDFPLEPNPVDKSSLGPYWRTDLHMEYYLCRTLNRSIYLDIRNLFDRYQSRGSTVSIENGTPESRFNFVLGFRIKF